MPIPSFQDVMLPLLKKLADGEAHSNAEILESLAQHFDLTDEERREMLPSGQDYVFRNRLGWARTHMKAAGLIDNPKRGRYVITSRGKELLASNPERVDLRLLKTYNAYQHFQGHRKPASEQTPDESDEQQARTPEERIEEAHELLRNELARQILEQLKGGSADFFEKVVVEVLVNMGYGGSRKDAGQAIGKSGDEGIDGIIKEDRLGLDIIYIQAKKWAGSVSRPEVQKFAGALQGKRARKGIFITTSEFSKGAHGYVSAIDSKIILVDGQRLAQMMIDFNVGVSTEAVYELKRIDSDYFAEG